MPNGIVAPWQNRPSLISCWEHHAAGFDISGDGISDIGAFWTGDNLTLRDMPFCIPRACRLTRVCLIVAVFDTDIGVPAPFNFTIEKNAECDNDSWVTRHDEALELQHTGFQFNCYCFDTSINFKECDLWRPDFIALGDPWYFPAYRGIFHFELR